ncbi:hypothetical protein SEA_ROSAASANTEWAA_1 [Streptomyces phage RosaAsantewaa]|nr:hypothetical protein SEA_ROSAASANTEWAA_1 [Streptomyces phage RosaAsantewaa]
MTVHRRKHPTPLTSTSRPAATPEARENQLISLAYDLVEQRIRDGTASAQEVTQFLKLGSSRERLEQQRLEYENKLTAVKIEAAESAARVEALYGEALDAMRAYQGQTVTEDDSDQVV